MKQIKKIYKMLLVIGFKFSVSQRGFTLLELLVVIVILGILATLGIVNFQETRLRARDAERKAHLSQLQQALELYRSDQFAYPASLPACGSPLQDPGGSTTYLQKVPCDPTNSGEFTYRYTLNGSSYTIGACLENENDSQKDPVNVAPCDGTTNFSYTVTNP